MYKMGNGVKDLYKGKNIFITGATGFLGTSLVEKLLRSFPEVKNIYLLMRKKVNKTTEERYAEYFNKKIFEKVKEINPNYKSYVTLLDGDLTSNKDLGLSASDVEELREEVNIVFHVGAIVNFTKSLKRTLLTNFNSTNELLKIFKEKNRLNSFVYVSTVYSNYTPLRVESMEKLYPPVADLKEVLDMVENMSEAELEAIAPQLTRKCINFYTFSKNLSENLVNLYKGNYPVGIFRPGAIVSTYKEPFPYWMQGSMAYEKILQEIDRGLLYKAASRTAVSTCIPVDMTANALIATAYDISKNENKLNIYNYACSKNPLTLKQQTEIYIKNIAKWKLIKSRLWYNAWLPFYGMFNKNDKDVIHRERYLQIFHKIANSFTGDDFEVENEHIRKVWKGLSKEDKKLIFCSLEEADWNSYYGNMTKGRIIDKA